MEGIAFSVPPSSTIIAADQKHVVQEAVIEVDPGSSSPQSQSQSHAHAPVHVYALTQAPMAHLLNQAAEVLGHIFQHVEPTDLASLSRTCRHLNRIIKNDELLWKLHYLARFDPPPASDVESWRSRLTRLVNLEKILASQNEEVKSQNLEEILNQTVKLTRQSIATSTKNSDFLADLYKQGININQVLCRSSLFARARPNQWPAAETEDLRQLSAQLHVLAGMNLDGEWPPSTSGTTCHHRRAGLFEDTETEDDDDDNDDDENGLEHAEHPNLETDMSPDGSSSNSEEILRLRNHPTPMRDIHPWARSRVYDLRRYKQSNMWGPFTDDGSGQIDWEKVQSIMIVLAYNHRMYTERRGLIGTDFLGLPTMLEGTGSASGSSHTHNTRSSSSNSRTNLLKPWESLFLGIAQDSYTSASLAGTIKPNPHPDLDALDPYGVTGTWMRIVCFLDYNDLYRFNFERHADMLPPDRERDPITTREAFRLIRLQLHVTRVEEQEGVDVNGQPLLPIVHFEGSSRSTFMAWDPNANSRIRGTVSATPAGPIRWTSFSIFHGEERWRSEGVQIGGLRSARGILGNWFDKDFDRHGPAGPTAFWKVSDEVVVEKRGVGIGVAGGGLVPSVMHLFMDE